MLCTTLFQMLFSVAINLILIFSLAFCEKKNETNEPGERIYTNSIRALSELREVENSYMEHLNNYVGALQRKVKALQVLIDSATHDNLTSKADRIRFVSNPLNSLALVRRAHQDWPKWMAYIRDQEMAKVDIEEMNKFVNLTPNAEDMQEALLGMDRIEHFYDLKSSDMAKGLVAGQQLQTRMSAPDLKALADYMYNQSEYRRAAQWYRLALGAITNPKNKISLKIYEPKREEIKKMFVISRLYEGSIDNLPDYIRELSKDPQIPLVHLRPKPPPTRVELGCRGMFPPGPQLVCRYNTTASPFMRLAPLKQEEISRNPLIWLYHDVIFDSEIAQLTNLTRDEMIQGYPDKYRATEKPYRLFHAKVTDDDGSKLDKTLVNRMADISGLYVGNATSLARVNYGLGSYFHEHGDYTDIKLHPELTEEGDRLMTFLFYMTDVPVGGATLFPGANLAIQPRKGSALFWYNLHNDGEPNTLTKHAVCPMILGNRWVLVKSMLYYDQMFKKPCYK